MSAARCEYTYWDRAKHKLTSCGKLGMHIVLGNCLCDEHAQFVKDAKCFPSAPSDDGAKQMKLMEDL
jgi:hypothetical protein